MGILIALAVVALGLCGLAVFLIVRIRRSDSGAAVMAEVSGFASYVSKGQTLYCAQYRAVVDGREVTGAASVSKSWKSPPLGTKVLVHYHPDVSENQLTDTSFVRYIAPLALLGTAALIGVMGMGLGSIRAVAPRPKAEAGARTWDGKEPLRCSGHEELTFSGVSATVDGTAITASGHCQLTLTNVMLAAATGIETSGSAVVTMQGGSITATSFAVHAAGSSQVHLTGTKISGKTQQKSSAVITGP